MSENKYMQNGRGHLVPVEQVTEYDQLKDSTVRELIARAEKLQSDIRDFKLAAMGDVTAFMQLALDKYRAKAGGVKGNVQLVSYDGTMRVQVAVAEFHVFDERLQAAKALVDECLHDWTEDARPEVRALVNQAFEVDKEGNVSPSRVLPLLKLEISDARWQEAMRAIKDSLTVYGSKQYIRFHRREVDPVTNQPTGKWKGLPLDIAAL